jgi:hypothetical protein
LTVKVVFELDGDTLFLTDLEAAVVVVAVAVASASANGTGQRVEVIRSASTGRYSEFSILSR